ncbi:DUF350 domain-containing protein [Pilimelia columellifera]|uniref:DUF350 domain-containing protein n=1 Tax=Pilimelia columellifera subsp. columellifera TaxID=706583 RepID=A0ABP6A6W4_9ACTN
MIKMLFTDLLVTAGYAGIGLALMAAGWALADLATPGQPHRLVGVDRNRNATIVLVSNIASIAAIAAAAVTADPGDVGGGMATAAVLGLVGLIVLTGAFLLLDLATPGDLGQLIGEGQTHPAIWVTATARLAAGVIIAAAIS